MGSWVDSVDDFLDTVPVGATFTANDLYRWLPGGDDHRPSDRLQQHRLAQRNGGTRNVAFCEYRGPNGYWRKINHAQYEEARATVARQGVEDLVRAYACEALAAARSDAAMFVRAETEINAAVTMMNAALAFMGIPPVAAP
jgi:hypothetical protein